VRVGDNSAVSSLDSLLASLTKVSKKQWRVTGHASLTRLGCATQSEIEGVLNKYGPHFSYALQNNYVVFSLLKTPNHVLLWQTATEILFALVPVVEGDEHTPYGVEVKTK